MNMLHSTTAWILQHHNSILLLLPEPLTGCASAYDSIVSRTVTTDASDLGGKLALSPAHSCACKQHRVVNELARNGCCAG